MGKNKYVWLIAENHGDTANNNSFYFWRYIVNHYNDVDAWFIASKSLFKSICSSLSEKERQYVVEKDSFRHTYLFFCADMLFVTLGFNDVLPERLGFYHYSPKPEVPLVYLKHGTLGIKRIEYKSDYANNSLARYMYYNPKIAEELKTYNGMKDYQLWYGMYPPRYMELVRRWHAVPKHTGERILWFITWREYFGENDETERFLEELCNVLKDERVQSFLSQEGNAISVCLHQFIKDLAGERIQSVISQIPNVQLLTPAQIDIMDAVAEYDLLITDYSSLGFDFTFLHKPVFLYQPDRDTYLQNRGLYCSLDELQEYSTSDRNELIDRILHAPREINPFFRSRMEQADDYEGVEEGKYIARMYDSLLELQKSCIVFFGYDYSGIGGTVFATKALAEGLREKGKLVRFITLNQGRNNHHPAGIPIHPIYNYRRKIDKIKAVLFGFPWNYGYLWGDTKRKNVHAVTGYGMKYWMKHIHANTVISTRESLHPYIQKGKAPLIQNRICFFHAPYNMIGKIFSDRFIEYLNTIGIEKAVFVTAENRDALALTRGLTNYTKSLVLGNALDSERSCSWEEIKQTQPGKVIRCAYLLRLSIIRENDLLRLIDFGKYLKKKKETQILIDVYGTGDYKDQFLEKLEKEKLQTIINYQGSTRDIKTVFAEHDCVLDFSDMQSFGMTYIEAVLNGRMVYCYSNPGSKEVLRDIPAIVSSHEEMHKRILGLRSLSHEDMHKYYEKVAARYSREVVTERFLRFLEE